MSRNNLIIKKRKNKAKKCYFFRKSLDKMVQLCYNNNVKM